MDQSHGKGESKPSDPDENDDDFGTKFAGFPPQRIHDGSISGKHKEDVV